MIKKILTHIILTITIVIGITHSVYAAQILTDWTNATSSSANGVLGSISVTFSASSSTIFPSSVNEGFSGYSNPSIYNPAIANSAVISFMGSGL